MNQGPQLTRTERPRPQNIDDRLNVAGFTEFLAEHPDRDILQPDEASEEVLTERFEVFEAKQKLKEDMRALALEHFRDKMELDVHPDKLAEILNREYDKMAIEQPLQIFAMRDRIKDFVELPQDINSLNHQLGALGAPEDLMNELASLTEVRPHLLTLKENLFTFTGIMNMIGSIDTLKSTFDSIKAVREKGIPIHMGDVNVNVMDIDDRVAVIDEALKNIDAVEEMKTIYSNIMADARKDIFASLGSSAEIADLLREKVQDRMAALARGGERDIEKVQVQFERFREISATDETGVDLFEGRDIVAIQNEINKTVEDKLSADISKAVTGFKLGDGNLSRMEETLGRFLTIEKLGSNEGIEAKRVIGQTLDTIMGKLPRDIKGQTKRILLQRIKIKCRL